MGNLRHNYGRKGRLKVYANWRMNRAQRTEVDVLATMLSPGSSPVNGKIHDLRRPRLEGLWGRAGLESSAKNAGGDCRAPPARTRDKRRSCWRCGCKASHPASS